MFWEADLRRGAYDPETLSMLSTVLERVVAALPHGDRTDERKARLASSILGQPLFCSAGRRRLSARG